MGYVSESGLGRLNRRYCTQIRYVLANEDYTVYFEGPWEVEPNNSYQQANGPLRSGKLYYGYSNDDGYPEYNKDYSSFYMSKPGSIRANMSNHPGVEPELQLFYQTTSNLVGWCRGASCEVSHSGNAGWYYIYISAAPPYDTAMPYMLQVTYP